jgi:hypothetical protein
MLVILLAGNAGGAARQCLVGNSAAMIYWNLESAAARLVFG